MVPIQKNYKAQKHYIPFSYIGFDHKNVISHRIHYNPLLNFNIFYLHGLGIKNQGNIISAMKNSLILTAKIILDIKINLIIAIVLGISAGDLIHYLLDVFTSYIKNKK
jgi:hypothetical protein